MLTTLTAMTKKRARKGRPPIPPEERRDKQIHIVTTADERQEIMAAAKAAGVTLNQWLRDLALKAARRNK